MKSPRPLIVSAIIIALGGCGQDSSTPLGLSSTSIPASIPDTATVLADTTIAPLDSAETNPGSRKASSLAVLGLPAIAVIGQTFLVRARLADDDGAWWSAEGPVAWASSDPSVAIVDQADIVGAPGALVSIVGEGPVTVTATSGGVRGSGQLIAIPVEPPLSAGLAIESFSVVEASLSDSAGAPRWFYAPLIVVRDRTGSGVQVYGVAIDIPGIGGPYCTSRRTVEPEGSRDLFPEVYGDYELTIDKPGSRATPGEATAVVYFVDGLGKAGKVVATTTIVRGPPFRDTYTGGITPYPWSCGAGRVSAPF